VTATEPVVGALAPAWRIWRVWFKQELLLLVREPVAVFFSLAFPLVIYVFIGVPYAEEVIDDSGTLFIDLMFPALIGTVAANLLLMGLPIYIAELRTRQVDKRYRVLPLSGVAFGGAVVAAMLVLVALAVAIIVALVALAHGVREEVPSVEFIALNLGLIAFLCPTGFFLGTLPFGARTIQALTAATFFVMFFGSGAAAPLDALPGWLRAVLEANPLKIWFDALVDVYIGIGIDASSGWKIAATLVVAVVAGAAGLSSWRRAS
jgi:ABC-2 type transport system permease protein